MEVMSIFGAFYRSVTLVFDAVIGWQLVVNCVNDWHFQLSVGTLFSTSYGQ